MSHENPQLPCRCRQLKAAYNIYFTWFFNTTVNLKLTDFDPAYKLSHIVDTKSSWELDNLDEFVNNAFLTYFLINFGFAVGYNIAVANIIL